MKLSSVIYLGLVLGSASVNADELRSTFCKKSEGILREVNLTKVSANAFEGILATGQAQGEQSLSAIYLSSNVGMGSNLGRFESFENEFENRVDDRISRIDLRTNHKYATDMALPAGAKQISKREILVQATLKGKTIEERFLETNCENMKEFIGD